jgi:hypothetical protein
MDQSEDQILPSGQARALKHLQAHYAVAEAETRTRGGKASVGDLAAIYLQGVELAGDIKVSTK